MSVGKKNKAGKYPVRVYMGTVDGKKKYSHDTFDTKKAADEHDRKLKNFRAGNPDSALSEDTVFGEVARAFLAQIELTKEHNTYKSYESKYRVWISPHLATFQIGNITGPTINHFQEKIKKLGIGDSTYELVSIVLYEIFRYASNPLTRYIIENPMTRVEKKPTSRPLSMIQYWSKSEAELFLIAAKGSPYYDSFVFILNTGIRFNEYACLRKESFDLNSGMVNVYEQICAGKKDGADFFIKGTKGKKHRSIPLNRYSKKIALKLIETSSDLFLFCPGDTESKKILIKKKNKTYVEMHKVVTNKTFAYALKSVCKRAGVKEIGPHGLRHTFSASFLMNGGNIFTLSKLLGHKSVNTTIDNYGHLSEEFLSSTAHIVSFGEGI